MEEYVFEQLSLAASDIPKGSGQGSVCLSLRGVGDYVLSFDSFGGAVVTRVEERESGHPTFTLTTLITDWPALTKVNTISTC